MIGIIIERELLRQFPAIDPMNKSGAIHALVDAIYETGCLIGAGGIIAFGDKLGRRSSVIIGACTMRVVTNFQAALFGLAQLYPRTEVYGQHSTQVVSRSQI
jgi:MFS family permease